MSDCIFCSIAAGDIPADVVHQDEHVVAFRDLNPQAPAHILVIPRVHVASAAEMTEEHDAAWTMMLRAANELARSEGFSTAGYRLVVNVRGHGGQTVDHLHMHLLGGRQMSWPPG
jgi:histidine triad (HIT) family protein